MKKIGWLGAVVVGMWSSLAAAQAAEPDTTAPTAREERWGKRHKPRPGRANRYRPRLGASPAASSEPASTASPADYSRLRHSRFLVGAEHLTNVTFWKQTVKVDINTGFETGSMETRASGVDFGVLGSGLTDNPFMLPRLGFDYVFGFGLSLGGSLGYFAHGGTLDRTSTDAPNTRTEDLPKTSAWLVSPRIGFFYAVTPVIALWCRGGLSYAKIEYEISEPDASAQYVSWDLSLEPQLLVSPVPHAALTLGVPLDIGLTGSYEQTSAAGHVTGDSTTSSYGVSVGVLAMF